MFLYLFLRRKFAKKLSKVCCSCLGYVFVHTWSVGLLTFACHSLLSSVSLYFTLFNSILARHQVDCFDSSYHPRVNIIFAPSPEKKTELKILGLLKKVQTNREEKGRRTRESYVKNWWHEVKPLFNGRAEKEPGFGERVWWMLTFKLLVWLKSNYGLRVKVLIMRWDRIYDLISKPDNREWAIDEKSVPE